MYDKTELDKYAVYEKLLHDLGDGLIHKRIARILGVTTKTSRKLLSDWNAWGIETIQSRRESVGPLYVRRVTSLEESIKILREQFLSGRTCKVCHGVFKLVDMEGAPKNPTGVCLKCAIDKLRKDGIKCKNCGKHKAFNEFPRLNRRKLGVDFTCLECGRQRKEERAKLPKVGNRYSKERTTEPKKKYQKKIPLVGFASWGVLTYDCKNIAAAYDQDMLEKGKLITDESVIDRFKNIHKQGYDNG